MNKYIPSLLSLSPTPPSQSSQVITEHRAEIPVLYGSLPLAIVHMVVQTCQCYTLHLSQSLLTPQPCPMSTSPFSRSASLPALQIGSSAPFFQILYIYIYMYVYIYIYIYIYIHTHIYMLQFFSFPLNTDLKCSSGLKEKFGKVRDKRNTIWITEIALCKENSNKINSWLEIKFMSSEQNNHQPLINCHSMKQKERSDPTFAVGFFYLTPWLSSMSVTNSETFLLLFIHSVNKWLSCTFYGVGGISIRYQV